MSKFIQIAIDNEGFLYALDQEGTIWKRDGDHNDDDFIQWSRSVEEAGAPKREKKAKSDSGLAVRPGNVTASTWVQFKVIRDANKKPLTKRALETIAKEGAKLNWDLETTLLKCIDKTWIGFEAQWIIKSGDAGLPPKLVL